MKLYFLNDQPQKRVAGGWLSNIEQTIEDVKKVNPDKIVVVSEVELISIHLWIDFFRKITPWLIEKNKYINFILPSVRNLGFERVIEEQGTACIRSYGIGNYIKDYNEHVHSLLRPNLLKDYVSFIKKDIFKLFTCYNNSFKDHRYYITELICKHKMLDEGIVTFIHPEHIASFPYLKWQYHDGSVLRNAEQDFELNQGYNAYDLPKFFRNGMIDIVTESWYEDGQYCITEKTLKSISMCKPFLALSCKGYYKDYLVKKFGFELYDEVFDYSFDECDDTEERAKLLFDNILRYRNEFYDPKFVTNFYQKINQKIMRNRFRVIDILNDKDIMIPDSLKILNTQKVELFGHVTDHYRENIVTYMKDMGWIVE